MNSHDSLSIDEYNLFAGLLTEFIRDNRNNVVFPSSGGYFNVQLKEYAGLNDYSKSFARYTSTFTCYKGFADDTVLLPTEKVVARHRAKLPFISLCH